MAETDAEQEPRIKTIEEYHERAPRRWPLLLGYILAALVIAVIVVFGARAIYHHYHKSPAKSVTTSSKGLSPTRPDESSGFASAKGSSSKSSTQPATNNLPNSGPGQVTAIFLGTSAAAAGAHYLIKLRRQKQF